MDSKWCELGNERNDLVQFLFGDQYDLDDEVSRQEESRNEPRRGNFVPPSNVPAMFVEHAESQVRHLRRFWEANFKANTTRDSVSKADLEKAFLAADHELTEDKCPGILESFRISNAQFCDELNLAPQFGLEAALLQKLWDATANMRSIEGSASKEELGRMFECGSTLKGKDSCILDLMQRRIAPAESSARMSSCSAQEEALKIAFGTEARIRTAKDTALEEFETKASISKADFCAFPLSKGYRMKSPIGFVYLKGFTAVHVAMRHSYLKFTAEQLRELHALDNKVFIRKDDYGATALHHYLKHTLKPDAELIRTIHELSVLPDGIFAEENKYYLTPVMDLFDNWHIFGPASPNLGEWYTHHRHWHNCTARQQRPLSSGGINGLNREDNGWEDSTAAIRRDNSFRATRDYRGVYEAAEAQWLSLADQTNNKDHRDQDRVGGEDNNMLQRLQEAQEWKKETQAATKLAIEAILELDGKTLTRTAKNGMTAIHAMFSASRLLKTILDIPQIEEAIEKIRSAEEVISKADGEIRNEIGDEILELAKTLQGKKVPTLGECLLGNKHETLDAFLRFYERHPCWMRQAVDAMKKTDQTLRNGLPGEIFARILRSGERVETESLIFKIISGMITSEDGTNGSELNYGDRPRSQFEQESGDIQGDERAVRRFANLVRLDRSFALNLYNFVDIGTSMSTYCTMMDFVLRLTPLRNPRKYLGWVRGDTLLLQARVFESVETTMSNHLGVVNNPDVTLDNPRVRQMRFACDCWMRSTNEFIKECIEDEELVQGLMSFSTRKSREKLTATAIMRCVIDLKYKNYYRYFYYIEMIMPCGILFLICFNEVLWSKRNTWPLWCIAALNFIVTIGFIRHARQVRKGRLNNLPLHLGFSATDDRALKASSGSEMAWKIIFHTEFQAQYFNGNAGRNGSESFPAYSLENFCDLLMLCFLWFDMEHASLFLLNFSGILSTWLLFASGFSSETGANRSIGVATGVFLWLNFFHRLKGFTKDLSTFVLVLQHVFEDTATFIIFLLIFLFAFATLFRIVLRGSGDDDEEYEDPEGLARMFWGLFRALLLDLGEHNEIFFSAPLLKVLFTCFVLVCGLILLNLFIALVSVAYDDAMNSTDRLFYGARLDLLGSLEHSPLRIGLGMLKEYCSQQCWPERFCECTGCADYCTKYRMPVFSILQSRLGGIIGIRSGERQVRREIDMYLKEKLEASLKSTGRHRSIKGMVTKVVQFHTAALVRVLKHELKGEARHHLPGPYGKSREM